MLRNTKLSREFQVIPRAVLDYGENEAAAAPISEKKLIKNFSTHSVLSNFFEENSGFLSLQWIKLDQQDKINVHAHDVDTLIINCIGECLLVGDMRKVLQEGDTAVIPKYFKHGLASYNNKLFWGISLRFYNTAQLLREP